MARIEGFSIKNYGVLRDITIGKLWNTQQNQSLTPMTVVIGKNGTGKSSLFDALGFLADCLKSGVEEACDARGRGGFDRIHSQGSNEPIEFQIYYRQASGDRPITYELVIDTEWNQTSLCEGGTPSPATQGPKTRVAFFVSMDERRSGSRLEGGGNWGAQANPTTMKKCFSAR